MTQPTATHVAPPTSPVPALPGSTERPPVPDDVRQFAEANGIAKYLPPLVELMERVVPGRLVTLRLGWDPEIPNDGYITFGASAEDLTVDEWLAAYRSWWDGVRALCEHDDTHFFSFGV